MRRNERLTPIKTLHLRPLGELTVSRPRLARYHNSQEAWKPQSHLVWSYAYFANRPLGTDLAGALQSPFDLTTDKPQ